MNSTTIQNPSKSPQPLTLKSSTIATSSKSKLPIKRKTLPSSQDPSFYPNPNLPSTAVVVKPPPFKFHRIWTEPDEIRFLRGLLDSASDGLLFPRDLHLFYHRFSTAMSQPYTKSQLSEKLRRLRKKFRAISSRLLRRGLDAATALSPHDRELYDLSKKLWSPEFASTSPFNKMKFEDDDAIGVVNVVGKNPNLGISDDGEMGIGYSHEKIGGVASKIVLDVYDECVEEAKMGLFWQGFPCSCSQNVEGFGKRWREQRALEFDVFAMRLRLVIENSLNQR
ncbi:probable transcription factor At5g28040 [Gastrolobium bilobum]|uniref:probable transcription factor At5g28040 n=1 Tax=Gastrolobium bilobum TaxID=150636 RepID=UPI002AB2D0DA|nr:probable transcription factor At5g28040 [Gastrolobium bilobum]